MIFKNVQKVQDIRLLRPLDYLLNIPNLQIDFTPEEYNKLADFFSRKQNKTMTIQYQDIPERLWIQAHKGHYGLDKTWHKLQRLTSQFSLQNVQYRIKRCRPCQMFKRLQPSDPLGHFG